MRIAIVLGGLQGGGLQPAALAYASALNGLGHQVLLALHRKSALIFQARSLGVSLHAQVWPRRAWLLRMLHDRSLSRALARFAPDVVLAIGARATASARANKPETVPLIAACDSFRPEAIAPLLDLDALFVTSPEMREKALSVGADPARIEIVPNFSTSAPLAPSIRAANRIRIGAIGPFDRSGGMDLLIQAAERMSLRGVDFDLTIAGAGRLRARLESLALRLGVNLKVEPDLKQPALGDFLRDLDVFAAPARFEPFGFTLLEALRAGLPIVTMPTQAARMLFPGGKGALVLPDFTPDSLAEGLWTLAEDLPARQILAREGQDILTRGFSQSAVAPALDRAIRGQTAAAYRRAQRAVPEGVELPPAPPSSGRTSRIRTSRSSRKAV